MSHQSNDGQTRYYLFVGEGPVNPANVIFDVAEKSAALDLLSMLRDEYAAGSVEAFGFEAIGPDRLRDSIRLDEILAELSVYDDPDPDVYEARPPRDLIRRAEMSRRAGRWYSVLLQRRVNDRRATSNEVTGSTPSFLDHPVDAVYRLLQKHRLMFLYFAVPGQVNPLAGDERSLRIQDHYLPKIPPDKIDADGEFLFAYKRSLEIYAQAAIAKFGSEEDLPRHMLPDGTIVEIEGSSVPYWNIDEVACAHLEESADEVLEACRHLHTTDMNSVFASAIAQVSSVLRDKDCTKWYASKLVSWTYLPRLDETLESLRSMRVGVTPNIERATEQDNDETATETAKDGEEESLDPESVPEMSAEDQRNSGVMFLLLLAQAYYKMLESTVSMAGWFTYLDLQLNHSYFWTIRTISNLLSKNEQLHDFPISFEPILPDLYPATIGDLEWSEMIAPAAEEFLATVQKYALEKGCYEPEEGTPAWIFVEMFRPSINGAIEQAEAYNKRMKEARRSVLKRKPSPQSETEAKSPEINDIAEKENADRRFEMPAGASWTDIEIRFIDGETVSIGVGDERRRFIYSDMYMVDERNKKPTKQWELLRTLAARNKKQKEVLNARLRKFFGLSGDPIVLTPEKDGWITKFSLSPD
jgi:hypothetical protein